VERIIRRRSSKLILVASLGILSLVTAISSVVPASASTGINVFVGYADSLRANPTNFPTPWFGSPNTVFYGCAPAAACAYDAGSVRIVNNTGSTVVVNAVAVHVDTCTFAGWPSATLAPGANLIVTQLATGGTGIGCEEPAHMDTSDVGPGGSNWTGHCSANGILPRVDITINGQTTSYTDAGQVLNTGGIDTGTCLGNESTQWTTIGHAPCKGSLLSLAPASQTRGVGTTATLNATFTNSCGQPLSNVAVNFADLSGPNAGRTGSATTDANGVATLSYSSLLAGTDTWRAAVTNLAGNITSNTVTVNWVLYAPGGGAFVISDLKDVNGPSVYWWGAQWWKQDPLSTGLAPAAFKGFEKSNLSPWCGQTWTTRPGNSPKPPRTVPGTMAVIVSSHIVKKGPVISGDVLHIVLVRTNPGYGPNPGHQGTGTIIGQLC
jgi:hypothetical protein